MSHPTPQPTAARRHRTRRSLRAVAASAGACLALLSTGSAFGQVGRTEIRIGALPVTLVYPTAQAARPVPMGPFTLNIAPDAPVSPGTHRLVVMSHGTGGSPITDHEQAATLARAGFVVAQPLHAGDNHLDSSRAGPPAWITRPQEVRQVIDHLGADPAWRERLVLDRVGVHGMSAGGGTALALAGGQWSVLQLVRHCGAVGDDDLGFCFNGLPDAASQAQRRQQYGLAQGVPDAHLPEAMRTLHGGRAAADGEDARPDPRIASVTAAVPVAAPFTDDSLARIRVPVGLVTAGADTMLPERHHAGRVLKACSACVRIAHVASAAHMDLLAPLPPSVAAAEASRQPRGGAPAPGFDPAQRQAAFDAVAAFHRRHLDGPAQPGLAPAGR